MEYHKCASFLWLNFTVNKEFCVKCLFSSQFVFLTYVLGVAWLGVFGFSAVPVFMFYNMWSTCEVIRSLSANMTSADQICVDIRQYGTYLNLIKCFILFTYPAFERNCLILTRWTEKQLCVDFHYCFCK